MGNGTHQPQTLGFRAAGGCPEVTVREASLSASVLAVPVQTPVVSLTGPRRSQTPPQTGHCDGHWAIALPMRPNPSD